MKPMRCKFTTEFKDKDGIVLAFVPSDDGEISAVIVVDDGKLCQQPIGFVTITDPDLPYDFRFSDITGTGIYQPSQPYDGLYATVEDTEGGS